MSARWAASFANKLSKDYYSTLSPGLTGTGIVTNRTTPVSHMAKSSIGYRSSKAKRGTGRVVSKGRISSTKKKSKKKTSKRKRVASGTFRTPKRLKRVSPKYHNHRYEQEGTCNAGLPFMYVGFNHCFNREAIWEAMADAILRPILAKELKFYPLQDTDRIGNSGPNAVPKTICFDFKRVSGSYVGGGVDNLANALDADSNLAIQRIDLDDTTGGANPPTYAAMRLQMSAMLAARADGNPSAAPAGDSVASFPYRYHVTSSINTSASTMSQHVLTTFEHVGETMLDLKFTQKFMVVNRTLAEGGDTEGQNLDRLGTNPLKGKLYQFKHNAPRILDHMKGGVDMSTALRSQIQQDTANGIAKYSSNDALDTHLSHPLAAKFWLKNCVKESSIYLAPGATKSSNTVTSIKGKVSTLIERFYYSGYDKGSFGASSLFMFDMVHKSSENPSMTYKRSCLVQSYGKLKQPKIYIPDFEAVTMNL